MKHLMNLLSTVLGAAAMGSMSVFAARGVIPWWLVGVVFFWAIALGVYVMMLGFENVDKVYADCRERHTFKRVDR